jgi:hypothetical protein
MYDSIWKNQKIVAMLNMNIIKAGIITSTLIACISCEKNTRDYRNKYCGAWTVEYDAGSWGAIGVSSSSGIYTDVTTYYNKENDSTLIFNFSKSLQVELIVDEKGGLSGCGYSGKINDENQFIVNYNSSECTLAMGGGVSAIYDGEKD